MKTYNVNLIIWNKPKVKLEQITEDPTIRPAYNPAEQAKHLAQFLRGHITGDTFDYLTREIAYLALPFDKINDESVKDMQTRVSTAINRLAER